MALTPAQESFCQKFVELNNASAAYKAAYRSCKTDRTAETNSSRLLRNAEVKARLVELREDLKRRSETSQEWVIERLKIEALREGDGSSHSARIQAIKLIGDRLGVWAERPPLEAILEALPRPIADALRRLLAGDLPAV